MWRLGGGDRARARRVGPQLTYLISHVHANGAGLTRPVQTLPERGEKKASQVTTAWGHCCPGDSTLASHCGGPAHPGHPTAGHQPMAWGCLPPAHGLPAQSKGRTQNTGTGGTSHLLDVPWVAVNCAQGRR